MTLRKVNVTNDLILVAGAGGFIGGHLVRDLRDQGCTVRAVDVKPVEDWYQRFDDVDNRQLDLSEIAACREAVAGAGTSQMAEQWAAWAHRENKELACWRLVSTTARRGRTRRGRFFIVIRLRLCATTGVDEVTA